VENCHYDVERASKLKGESDLDTIRNVLVWMDQNLKYDETKPDRWRNYDDVTPGKANRGCADQGIVCGVSLKGAKIPAVWVKTMEVSWIMDFKKSLDRSMKKNFVWRVIAMISPSF